MVQDVKNGKEEGGKNGLPKSWRWVAHKDIAEINPKLPFDNMAEDTEVSFLPMASVEAVSGRYDLSQVRKYSEVKKGYTSFINGDLIFAKITPCMENGKIALLEKLTNGIGFGSTEFHVSRISNLTNRNYFFYYFNQEFFRRDARKNMTGSAGQLRVSKTYFEDVSIPIPPLAEQHRIVAKIEELFSDLDAGIESLKTARAQLKIYRQAVLKWAFEGKLTAQWREEQKRQGKLESAETLLEKIKAEREQRYQTELAAWKADAKAWEANGQVGKKPGKPKAQKDISLLMDVELEKLPKITSDWCWVKVGLLLLESPSNGKSVGDRPGGFRVLRLTSIKNGLIDLDKSKEGDWDEIDALCYIVHPGDFLISRGNGSIKLVGLGGLVTNQEKVAYPDTMVRLPINTIFYVPKLFALIWNSEFFRKQIELVARTTAGIYKINQDHILNFTIPLIPLAEQLQIVQEIESRLSICDSLEATITENLQRSEALRQSILKHAFEGKLVPQDPNDEPAEKLLERIKQDKVSTKKPKQLKINFFPKNGNPSRKKINEEKGDPRRMGGDTSG